MTGRAIPGYVRAVPRVSKFLLLLLVPIMLGIAAWWCWQHAFEIHPAGRALAFPQGMPPPHIVLSGGDRVTWDPVERTVLLVARKDAPPPSMEIKLDPWPDGALAHVRIAAAARNLETGKASWECGRVTMIWRGADGQVLPGFHGLTGIDGNNSSSSDVVAPMLGDGPPSIMIQNLGIAGGFAVSRIDVSVLRYRAWLPWACGVLIAGFWVWTFAVIRRTFPACRGWIRQALATTLCVVASWYLVFPGPWSEYHSIGPAFDIPASTGTTPAFAGLSAPVIPGGIAVDHTPAHSMAKHPPLAAPGRMDAGWFWETYTWVKQQARVVLHMLVFAGMTILLKICLGGGRAWLPVAVIAVASESMQYLFGFGFDWQDTGDLLVDAAGIAIGYFSVRRLLKRANSRIPQVHP